MRSLGPQCNCHSPPPPPPPPIAPFLLQIKSILIHFMDSMCHSSGRTEEMRREKREGEEERTREVR